MVVEILVKEEKSDWNDYQEAGRIIKSVKDTFGRSIQWETERKRSEIWNVILFISVFIDCWRKIEKDVYNLGRCLGKDLRLKQLYRINLSRIYKVQWEQ